MSSNFYAGGADEKTEEGFTVVDMDTEEGTTIVREQPDGQEEQPAQKAEQPAQQAEQPAQQAEQPAQQAEQQDQQAEQSAEQAQQPAQQAEQPVQIAEQLAKEDSGTVRQSLEIWHSARPEGYETFSILNSIEHEILNSHKYKNIKKCGFY